MRTWILAIALAATGPGCGDNDDDKPDGPAIDRDWRDEIVYQLVTDRFANGDTTNDDGVDLLCNTCWHGGDWQGIIDRLDYLAALGVTALWISPVIDNADSPMGSDGYHAYWPLALDRANPRFGGQTGLESLVTACHDRGIKVIVDVVVNHFGPIAYYDINENEQLDNTGELAPPFNAAGVQNQSGTALAPMVFFEPDSVTPAAFANPEWFHRRGQITDWNDNDQLLSGDFQGGLRDLNTERADVRAAITDVTRDWLRRVGVDGMRLDAVKHIQDEFWVELLPALRETFAEQGEHDDGLLTVAEVFDGYVPTLAGFTESPRFDSVLNFAAKFHVFDEVFKRGSRTSLMADLHRDKESAFPATAHEGGVTAPPGRVLLNFLDNHDVTRFLHDQPEPAALRAALTYLMTMDGVPVIYYGTEQSFNGGLDPLNREDLWDSGYDTGHETFQHIAALARLRRELEPLRRGDTRFVFTTDHTGSEVDAGMAAFERATATERVLVVINTSDHESTTASGGNPMLVSFAPGTVLSDRLGNLTPLTVAADGSLAVTLPARSAAVLVP